MRKAAAPGKCRGPLPVQKNTGGAFAPPLKSQQFYFTAGPGESQFFALRFPPVQSFAQDSPAGFRGKCGLRNRAEYAIL